MSLGILTHRGMMTSLRGCLGSLNLLDKFGCFKCWFKIDLVENDSFMNFVSSIGLLKIRFLHCKFCLRNYKDFQFCKHFDNSFWVDLHHFLNLPMSKK